MRAKLIHYFSITLLALALVNVSFSQTTQNLYLNQPSSPMTDCDEPISHSCDKCCVDSLDECCDDLLHGAVCVTQLCSDCTICSCFGIVLLYSGYAWIDDLSKSVFSSLAENNRLQLPLNIDPPPPRIPAHLT